MENTMNQCFYSSLPDFSFWGLPAYLGFTRCNATATTLPNGELPSFSYLPGSSSNWLIPTLPNANVYFLSTPLKINIAIPPFYYLCIKELNCMDETSPYNVSNFTLTTNGTNSRVNNSFARVTVNPNPNSFSEWYNPYKLFIPPAERIRRLTISVRSHNGQLVNFLNLEYSFMVEFTLYSAQIARHYNLFNPQINR
jgi:hypothetical protein